MCWYIDYVTLSISSILSKYYETLPHGRIIKDSTLLRLRKQNLSFNLLTMQIRQHVQFKAYLVEQPQVAVALFRLFRLWVRVSTCLRLYLYEKVQLSLQRACLNTKWRNSEMAK